MGREKENRWPGAGGPPLGGQHGAVYFPSGTKGQQPLVFPAQQTSEGGRQRQQGRSRLRRVIIDWLSTGPGATNRGPALSLKREVPI